MPRIPLRHCIENKHVIKTFLVLLALCLFSGRLSAQHSCISFSLDKALPIADSGYVAKFDLQIVVMTVCSVAGFVFLWHLYRKYAGSALHKRNKSKVPETGKSRKKSGKTTTEFTRRELEIILLSREGLLAKEIAKRLGISVNTVNNHKTNIFRKIKVNNTMEMVQYALKHKIIPVE